MGKNTIAIGSPEFKVDLQQLQVAIGTVQQEAASLRADEATLLGLFTQIEVDWQSPAGKTFVPLKDEFSKSFAYLLQVLEQTIHRMQTTYQNYLVTEEQNSKNVGHIPGNGGGGNGGGGGGGHRQSGSQQLSHYQSELHQPGQHQPGHHQPGQHPGGGGHHVDPGQHHKDIHRHHHDHDGQLRDQ